MFLINQHQPYKFRTGPLGARKRPSTSLCVLSFVTSFLILDFIVTLSLGLLLQIAVLSTNYCLFFFCWEFKQIILQPNRPDEMARIQAAGGRVLFINGYRVRGILAMSRAIGINVCTFTSFYSMRLLLVIPSVFIYHQ